MSVSATVRRDRWLSITEPGLQSRSYKKRGVIFHFAFFQRVEKTFSARWQTIKKDPEAEQLAPVGVHRYGRARVAMEVKILAEQAELQQNRSLYVILRNAVTKNLFSTEVRRSFAFAQDDIERNLD